MTTHSSYLTVASSLIEDVSPLFSVLIAAYNVEPYLKSAFYSLQQQTAPSENIEYIIVDDGSEDNTLEKAKQFVQNGQLSNAVVISQEHGGVGFARRTALAQARGEWITSFDPDDVLSFTYFAEVKKFIDADEQKQISLLSTRVLPSFEETGHIKDNHPLGSKFTSGNRVVSMLADPSAVQMGATTFLRRGVLEKYSLTYDTTVQPTFEDGHLICRYLAHFEEPIVGLVASARYYYRKRANISSLVQTSWENPHRYTTVLRNGYLDCLKYMKDQQGTTPDWLAFLILYDLMWYFKEDQKMGSVVSSIDAALKEEFSELVREIFTYFTLEHVVSLPFNKPDWNLREALLIGFGLDKNPARVYKYKMQREGFPTHSLYTTPGDHFIEVFVNGESLEPQIDGVTNRMYFGRSLAQEIKLRVPEGRIAVFVDRVRLQIPPHTPRISSLEEATFLEALNSRVQTPIDNTDFGSEGRDLFGEEWVATYTQQQEKDISEKKQREELKAEVLRLKDSSTFRRFDNCWIVLDHPDRADDNGEHFYRYLLNQKPEVKAYFLLEENSSDWARLEAEGFHLLNYGSSEAMAATLLADVVLSSDAVEECMYPAPRKLFGPPKHKFVFLQHGISVNDISNWLNPKSIDLLLTSSNEEYDYFVRDNSPYELTQQQVALTGIPRFDALYRKHNFALSQTRSKIITIMPTWRKDIADTLKSLNSDSERVDYLVGTDFYQSWVSLLQNPEFQKDIEQHNLTVRISLHPTLGKVLNELPSNNGVEFFIPGEGTARYFQSIIMSTDVFVTDYSSVAFDYAFIGKPVLYYQFDGEGIFTSKHTLRRGFYNFSKDAVGPVATTVERLVQHLEEALLNPERQRKMFTQQLSKAFTYRDDKNSERVFATVEAMLHGNYEQLLPENTLTKI